MTIQELLEKHEGRKKKPYRCPAGYRTIGVGWNMDNRPLPPGMKSYLDEYGEITEEMIDQLLEISIKVATSDCEDLFPDFDNFSDNRRMALVDFLFNIGKRRAMGFRKAIAAINTGRWEDAAREIQDSQYWRQLGGDPAGTDDGKLERPEEIAMMLEEG